MDVVSENHDKQTELTYVTNVLLANGYPKQQIEKVKRKISRKVILTFTEVLTTEEPKAYVNLPYIVRVISCEEFLMNIQSRLRVREYKYQFCEYEYE